MTLNRDVQITYLGHSTLLIVTPGHKRILIDLWTTGNPMCPPEYRDPAALGKLDVICVTHLHSDHVGDAAAILAANPEANVVALFETALWLHTQGAKTIHAINKGGTLRLDGLEITLTHAIHSNSVEGPDGTRLYIGEPAGFVIKLVNGFTLYAAGDTALFGDMSLLQLLYRPDLAFLPIGDVFTMGPREAAHAVRLLDVAHVVPIHWGTFPDELTGTPEAFQAELNALNLTAVTVHNLKPGETLT